MNLTQIAKQVRTLQQKILVRGRRSVRDGVRIGRLLIHAKKHCQHGEWRGWVDKNCGFSTMQAYRYRRLAEYFTNLKSNDSLFFTSLEDAYAAAEIPSGAASPTQESEILGRALEIKRDRAITREARLNAYRDSLSAEATLLKGKRWEVLIGDMQTQSKKLEPNSVNAIITDPDYRAEAFALNYKKLGEIANRVLAPHGNLITFCAHTSLSKTIEILSASGLQYQWTLAYTMTNSAQRIWHSRVVSSWIPILWFTKGKPLARKFVQDVVSSPAREKDHHNWEKSEAAVGKLVEWFSNPNDLILDPCCGGGSIPVAAVRTGRRCIAIDIDPRAAKLTAARLCKLDGAPKRRAVVS